MYPSEEVFARLKETTFPQILESFRNEEISFRGHSLEPQRQLDPAVLGIEKVTPRLDPSGFLIGGVNSLKTISNLKSLNGIPIHELEQAMRPFCVSRAGYLGSEDKLIPILLRENRFVRNSTPSTHQDFGFCLQYAEGYVSWMEAASRFSGVLNPYFELAGETLFVLPMAGAHQIRIFGDLNPNSELKDYTQPCANFIVGDLTTGNLIKVTSRHSALKSNYGFYQGLTHRSEFLRNR